MKTFSTFISGVGALFSRMPFLTPTQFSENVLTARLLHFT
jgi:hypothetical protein